MLGAAAGLGPASTSVKRVNAILRLRIPTVRANGAITTSGAIKIQTCISAAAGACHLDHPRKD